MADLLAPDGDTDRPSPPSSGSRPWAGGPGAPSPAPAVDVLPDLSTDEVAGRGGRRGRGRAPRRDVPTERAAPERGSISGNWPPKPDQQQRAPKQAASRPDGSGGPKPPVPNDQKPDRAKASGHPSNGHPSNPQKRNGTKVVKGPKSNTRSPDVQSPDVQRRDVPKPDVQRPGAQKSGAQRSSAPRSNGPASDRAASGQTRNGPSTPRRPRRPRTPKGQRQPVAPAALPQRLELPMPQEPEGGWTVQSVEEASFPTRMARRRALQSAQIENLWSPDPLITGDVLERVEDELARLLDRRVDLDGLPVDESDDELYDGDERDDLDDAMDDAIDETEGSAALHEAGTGGLNRPAANGDLLPQTAVRSRRRLALGVVTGVVALVCVTALVVWTVLGGGSRDEASTTGPTAAPTQNVLALALANGGRLTGVSLLASGAGGAQQVLVPSRLLLDVPGAGRIAVAQSLAPGASAPGAALADALEIRVDGTWVLEGADLARLVDAVGGLDVDVDVDVTQGVAAGAKILVTQGQGQHLNGSQAVAFAQFLVDGEPEATRLARQERVVTALLAALPTEREARLALVTSGSLAPTGPVLESVLGTTGALHDPARDGTLGSTLLPVREIDSGGDVSSYGLDGAAASAMVQNRLAGAVIVSPPGGRTRVLVQNGVGAPGLGDAARSRLVAAGLKYVGGGNVDGFGVTESVVVLSDGSSSSRARGLAVAKALGLGESALRVSDSAPTIADLVVVLGSDFTAS